MRQLLIVITDGFPYGDSEPYLEAEIPYLAEKFKKIIIVSAIDTCVGNCRKVPDNVSLSPIGDLVALRKEVSSYKKYLYLVRELYNEVSLHVRYRKVVPRRSILHRMVSSIESGLAIKNHIDKILYNSRISCRDIVIYSYWSSDLAVATAMLKEKSPDLYTLARAHGWDLYFERSSNNYIPLRPLLLKTLDCIHPVSAQGASYLDLTTRMHYSKKIDVRYLGVEKPLKNEAAEASGVFRIVSCARLVPLKRVSIIVDALKLVAIQGEVAKIEWYHIGGGPLYDELIEKATNTFAEQTVVDFYPMGKLENEDVLEFYGSTYIDILLSVSQWEGLPVSMMEAAAHGIPVISTNVGGVSEIVGDGYNGRLLTADANAAEVCRIVCEYIQMDKSLRYQYRCNAKRVWISKFNSEKNYQDWAESLVRA